MNSPESNPTRVIREVQRQAMSLIPGNVWGVHGFKNPTWVDVKIMVLFGVPIIIRHLIFRVPKKGP